MLTSKSEKALRSVSAGVVGTTGTAAAAIAAGRKTMRELTARDRNPPSIPTKFSDTQILRYKHNVDDVLFPQKVLYHDFLSQHGLTKLDLKNWNIYPLVFRNISESCVYLYLDNCAGVTLENMEMIRGHKQLKRLSLAGTQSVLDVDMAKIIASFKVLLSVNLSHCHFTTEGLRMLALNCANVNSFTAEKATGIDNFGLHAIGQWIQRFRTLQTIDLCNTASSFGDDGILDILTVGFNTLTDVNISGCRELTSLCITGLRSKMSVLTKLNLNHMNLRASAFEWITEGCRELIDLDLSRSPELDDAGLAKIGRQCWNLKHLNVSKCIKVSDAGMVGFMSRFEGLLESIDLSGCIQCGSAAIEAIATRASELQVIRLNGLSRVSSPALTDLWTAAAESMVTFQMCCELRSVTTHRKSMMPHFSDEVLLNAKYGSMLKEVELTGACLVTDTGACELAQRSPKLRVLNLSYCNAITDRTMLVIASCLPKLEVLDCSGCIKITTAGIVALGSGVCEQLTKLQLTGCSYIQDPGMRALGNLTMLEHLGIRGLDFVSDEGITALARHCTKLQYLEMTGLDLVTVRGLRQLIRHCENLTTLNCETCAFTPGEFAATVGHKLPFAKAANHKCKLDVYPAPLINYNKYVQQLRVKNKSVLTLQRFSKNMLVEKWKVIIKQAAYKRLRDMRVTFHAMRLAIKSDEKEKRLFEKNKHARRLQYLMRRLMAVHLARRKGRHLRHHTKAAVRIQSRFRGYRTRKRTYWVFKRLYYFYSKIGHLVHKLLTITQARRTHRRILATQAFARMVPVRAAYWRFLTGIIELQRRTRAHLDGGRAAKLEAAERERLAALDRLYYKSSRTIQRNIKAAMFNKYMSPFILTCCIWFRTDWDERLWNSVVLQKYWRGYSVRLACYKRKKKITEREDSALLIQSKYRAYVARCWYSVACPRMRRVLAGWKRFFIYKMPQIRLGTYCRRVQKFCRLYWFICGRIAGAETIQRVYRGFKGRRRFKDFLYSHSVKEVEKIQHCWYCFRQRKRRELRAARRHMAFYKIETLIDSFFEVQRVKQRKIDAALKARADLIEFKKEALFARRSLVVQKIRNDYRNRMATRIQRRYRKYLVLKRKREAEKAIEDAEAAEEALVAEEANRQRVKTPAARKGVAATVLGPLRNAYEAAREVKDMLLGSSQLIPTREIPKFNNAVLRYQVKTILQRGIVEIHLTMGEVEMKSFASTQNQLSIANLPHYEMIPNDISGLLDLKIQLWAMFGEGNECITKLVVEPKPQMSVVALNTRRMNKRLEGIKVAWHEMIPFEIQGWCTIKQGLGDFAVSNIAVTNSLEDEDRVQRNPNMIMEKNMSEFGMRSIIWIETRVLMEEDNMHKLGTLSGQEWWDDRLLRIIKAFNLSEADVFSMHAVFEDIRRGTTQAGRKNIRVDDMYRHIDYSYTKIAKWVILAISPASKFELSFSEYVHVISFYCMLVGSDLEKFLFVNADDGHKEYLRCVSVHQRIVSILILITPGTELILYSKFTVFLAEQYFPLLIM